MRISDWSSDVCSSDLATTLSAAPYSAFARAATPASGGRSVTMLTTPPIAWLPQGTELAPRSTSTRSTEPDSRMPKSNARPGDEGSLTRTTQINTSVSVASEPRMSSLANVTGPANRVIMTPGDDEQARVRAKVGKYRSI